MKKTLTLASTSLIAVLTLGANEAEAFDGKLEATYGIGSIEVGGASARLNAPKFDVFVPVGDSFGFGATWGFGWVNADGNGSPITFNNPFVSGHYKKEMGPMRFRLGLGVGIPLASDEFGEDTVSLAAQAGAYGAWDYWLYAPKTLSIVLPARIEFKAGPVILGGDAAIAGYIGTGDYDSQFGFQLGGDVLVPIGLFGVGAQLRAVSVPTADVDTTQISLEPFAQVSLGPARVRAGFIFNLDDPYGFGGITSAYAAHISAALVF
jgi:hypothetical protein